ncbi:MAG: hypothetical protein K2J80_09525 [Oscillospiraceae bacterium]|nr:hypothetical protein [Oscillospiraceae bacterium]
MIDELDKIDLARFDKRGKTVYMVIYDMGYAGCNLDERCELLRQKVENYVNYILNGGMIKYFSIKDKLVNKLKYEIQLFSPEYPPQEYLNYLSWISIEVSNANTENEIKVTCVAP